MNREHEKSEKLRLREEVSRLRAEVAELRAGEVVEDTPLGIHPEHLYAVKVGGKEFCLRAASDRMAFSHALLRGWGNNVRFVPDLHKTFGVVQVQVMAMEEWKTVTEPSFRSVEVVPEWVVAHRNNGNFCGHRHSDVHEATMCLKSQERSHVGWFIYECKYLIFEDGEARLPDYSVPPTSKVYEEPWWLDKTKACAS